MGFLKELCVLLLVTAAVVSAASRDRRDDSKFKCVCYLGSWANYRPGEGKFLIEDIDPTLCTHLIYGFAKLQNNQIAAYDPYLDLKENWGLGAFERFNNLKQKNPGLQTLIAIGGWNEGSTKYSQMAADAGARATFIKSVIDFLQKYNFDGIDMDWEYPANRGGVAADKENFVTLLKEMRVELDKYGFLLTAAVAAGKWTIDTAYDIPGVAKYLHFINVMAYDLRGSWESITGHHAQLYERDGEAEGNKILNVDYAINYWIKNGAPKEKIILGMGLYGRSFTLANSGNSGIGAPTTGPGSAGPVTKEPGMLGYNEICLKVREGWEEVFVDKVDAPYCHSGNQWVGYDNQKSIEIKVDYIIKNGLGGGMVWSLETDDFRGKCFGHKYPLLSIIAEKLLGNIERQTVDPAVITTREPGVTTTSGPIIEPQDKFDCPSEGWFRDEKNCQFFYQCVTVGDKIVAHRFDCGESLAFDTDAKVCNHRNLLNC